MEVQTVGNDRRVARSGEDREGSLHVGRILTEQSLRRGAGSGPAVEPGEQHLSDRPGVVRGLLGDLVEPVDAADAGLHPAAVELVDGSGEPLAGLTLPGELAVLAGLVTVLGQLLKAQPGPDQDREHREQLQGTVA